MVANNAAEGWGREGRDSELPALRVMSYDEMFGPGLKEKMCDTGRRVACGYRERVVTSAKDAQEESGIGEVI